MRFAYKAYNILSSGFFFTFFPPFWLYTRLTGRYVDGLNQRLGFYNNEIVNNINGSPKIWIHGASVGEVGVAMAIIKSLSSLMPGCAVILSTTTEHGQYAAREKIGSKATCVYAPVDFIASVHMALSAFKPDALVCLETEIWPNWLVMAHRMGIKTAIVNGRISVRSIKGYRKIPSLIKDTLLCVNAFSMISKEDAWRIKSLGAPSDRIKINGNAKYDILLNQVEDSRKKETEKLYNLKGDEPVFVAGSTRGTEPEIILDVYEKIIKVIPETILIIAPRHVEKVYYIKNIIRSRGFSYQLQSDLNETCLRTSPIVIVDTMGHLKSTYSIASIAFCGGSLEPLGGQNVLEPAAWSKPVFYGPSMEDFLDARALLKKTGGGIQVENGMDLTEKAIDYLTHSDKAFAVGQAAKKAVMLNRGAAEKHALVIKKLIT